MEGVKSSSSTISGCNSSSSSMSSQSEEDQMMMMELRRGPWTVEEDLTLINYIANHGEGRWNSLARCAGLKRTGKSCRLRWLNYLRPDVRRGNITLEEQLLILELHSRWGNRWSKIAQHLPGRTDNEIKNYWRTRVQKHAKQLKCDVNSKQFKDTMRYLWMPRLVERIHANSSSSTVSVSVSSSSSVASPPPPQPTTTIPNNNHVITHNIQAPSHYMNSNFSNSVGVYTSENSSPVSDLTELHYNSGNNYGSATGAVVNNVTQYYNGNPSCENYFQYGSYQENYDQQVNNQAQSTLTGGCYGNVNYHNHQGLVDMQAMDHQSNWNGNGMDGLDQSSDMGLWNTSVDDFWFLQQ